jgi:hypothetical protein
MTAPDTRLLRVFHRMLSRLVAFGDPVMPIAVERDLDGRLTALAFGLDPAEVHAALAARAADPAVAEVAYALDRWASPGQGVDADYGDLLTVFHWLPRRGWRLAVVPYRADPLDVQPYDWANKYWLAACAHDLRLMDHATARLAEAARGRQPAP